MFEVELDWPVCPDGVEVASIPDPKPNLFPYSPPGEVPGFRTRSNRRRTARRRLDLADAVSVRLANIYAPVAKAPPNDRAVEFLRDFGFPDEAFEIDAQALEEWSGATASRLASAVSEPSAALAVLGPVVEEPEGQWQDVSYTIPSGDDDYEESRREPRSARMSLDVHLIPGPNGGRPKTILRPRTLRDFVLLEVVTVACTEGVGFRSCDFCGVRFLTGPGTDRRSTSRFCRDLHRVYFAQKRPGGLPASADGSGSA